MGSIVTVPLNEAVYFLSQAAPEELKRLQTDLPIIADDLRPGIMAGGKDADEETKGAVLQAKAQAMLVALQEAKRMCGEAIPEASARLQRGGTIRFCCQVVTAVASGGVLGALGFSAQGVAGISGFLALLASIGSLFADKLEHVIDPNRGNLSTVYLQLVDARYKAGALHDTLRIQIDHADVGPAMEEAIAEGNALCEHVNRSFHQIVIAHARRPKIQAGPDVDR